MPSKIKELKSEIRQAQELLDQSAKAIFFFLSDLVNLVVI